MPDDCFDFQHSKCPVCEAGLERVPGLALTALLMLAVGFVCGLLAYAAFGM